MNAPKKPDPLHGITLEQLLTALVAELGWAELGARVPVRCFLYDPSIKSSLTFLRKTPWARARVEAIYIETRRGRDGPQ
jgi:uncharacterized protein (DUF2132 family)